MVKRMFALFLIVCMLLVVGCEELIELLPQEDQKIIREYQMQYKQLSADIQGMIEIKDQIVSAITVKELPTKEEPATDQQKTEALEKYKTHLEEKKEQQGQQAVTQPVEVAKTDKVEETGSVTVGDANRKQTKVYTSVMLGDGKFIIIDPDTCEPVNDKVYKIDNDASVQLAKKSDFDNEIKTNGVNAKPVVNEVKTEDNEGSYAVTFS